MAAYLEGVRLYQEGKTRRNIRILAERTGLDRDLLETACWPTLRSDGRIDFEAVDAYQSWALEKGLLDRMISGEEFSDIRFLETALDGPHSQTE